MKCFRWQQLSAAEQKKVLARPRMSQDASIQQQVDRMIDRVRAEGDRAMFGYSEALDRVVLDRLSIDCSQPQRIRASYQAALEKAIQTIGDYHRALMPKPVRVSTAKGLCLTKRYRPIPRVGFYVPGGETPLISSLLMLAVPAKIAGNPLRVICSPPNRQGFVCPVLKTAARLCDIDNIYTVGGAQAIAAMAYGTESIPAVDKIFGPGNRFVTAAKSKVAVDPNGASIDMPAGPSELMVLADTSANPRFIAADLLSQAEHGPDSQVLLITTDNSIAEAVLGELAHQQPTLPRQDIIAKALSWSRILLVENRQQMIEIANAYAAEHLIINCEDAEALAETIDVAGTFFLGPWAAEAMGDYMTGCNHVLPTYGFARSMSGLTSSDFLIAQTVQQIERDAVKTLGVHARSLAEKEGLMAHANAIAVREEEL